MNDFNMCPVCGSKKISCLNNRKWFCSDCGFDLYNNTAAAAGLVLIDGDVFLILEKRAKEPRKGFLALPGGFIDFDETAEEACIRECSEELGAEIEGLKYICSFPNTYEYKGITYKTCDLFFEARLKKGSEIKIQEREVAALERVRIKTMVDIEKLPHAFESARRTLKHWFLQKEKN